MINFSKMLQCFHDPENMHLIGQSLHLHPKKKNFTKKKPVKKQRPCAPAPPPTFQQRSASACPTRSNALRPKITPCQLCHRSPSIRSSSAGSRAPPARDLLLRDQVRRNLPLYSPEGSDVSASIEGSESAATALLAGKIGHH
jgi:hypothetical protein